MLAQPSAPARARARSLPRANDNRGGGGGGGGRKFVFVCRREPGMAGRGLNVCQTKTHEQARALFVYLTNRGGATAMARHAYFPIPRRDFGDAWKNNIGRRGGVCGSGSSGAGCIAYARIFRANSRVAWVRCSSACRVCFETRAWTLIVFL